MFGALGRLEPQSEVRKIHAPAVMEPPRVHRMLVEEGQWVQEGDVLATLDTEQRNRASLREAKAAHAVAERTLQRVLAGAKPAEIEAQKAAMELVATNLLLAESQLRRSESLLKSNAASIDAVDEQKTETEALRKSISGRPQNWKRSGKFVTWTFGMRSGSGEDRCSRGRR